MSDTTGTASVDATPIDAGTDAALVTAAGMQVTPNLLWITQHFEALYRPGHPQGYVSIVQDQKFCEGLYSADVLLVPAAHAYRSANQHDVFHGVNTISPAAIEDIQKRHGRGNESEVGTIDAFVADIDAIKPAAKWPYPAQEKILECLEKMPLQVSLLNLSGRPDGGYHAFWLLLSPAWVMEQAVLHA